MQQTVYSGVRQRASTSVILLAAALLTLIGCKTVPPPTGICQEALIYGADNRIEAFEVPSDRIWAFAHGASVALMEASKIVPEGDTAVLRAVPLGEDLGLCPSERFVDQPRAAFCSGVLIDHDLVLTAGHCIKSANKCRTTRFVFDYLLLEESGGVPPLSVDSVYSCDSIVARELDPATGRDYAIVRLDRPAIGRMPASLSPDTRSLRTDEPVVVLGYGMGIPLKIDEGGVVRDVSRVGEGRARVTTDTFVGNSGSPVLDRFGRVVGILVRGQNDFEDSCGCKRARRVQTGGEEIMTANVPLEALCDTGWPTPLCGRAAECGDDQCTGAETAEECPADCATATCGNGICEGTELTRCAVDCEEPEAPAPEPAAAEWTCPQSYFDTNDGCDCNCGTRDPDCDRPGQMVLNCTPGQVCGADGTCSSGTSLPGSWTCDAALFDAGDACNCNCGAYDPDCADGALTTVGCAGTEVCGTTGVCRTPDTGEAPASWTCSQSYWDAVDGCDCDCGAYDPDCDDEEQLVFGCDVSGVCLPSGICAGP